MKQNVIKCTKNGNGTKTMKRNYIVTAKIKVVLVCWDNRCPIIAESRLNINRKMLYIHVSSHHKKKSCQTFADNISI